MDKIWYRNPSKSEVIGRCGGDEKNRITMQNWQKSNAKQKQKQTQKNTYVRTPVTRKNLKKNKIKLQK